MTDFINTLIPFLQTSVQMGTHILFAVLGGILCEKAGNMNLGIEGMMLLGAAFGFKAALITSNPLIALVSAGIAGSAGALLYAIITVTLRGNQVVTGLILTIFGTGVSSFLGRTLGGHALPENFAVFFAPVRIPLLSKIPIIGKVFFEQSPFVITGICVAILLYIYLQHTKIGLNLRAVGENPAVADAAGINVTLYKYIHICAGGFLCGEGGAYLSLVFVPRWQENITAGAGWIAVALIIFSLWNPLRALYAAYLFGMLKGLGFKLQGVTLQTGALFVGGLRFAPQILDMLPYIATIVVLLLITLRKKKEYSGPAALGTPYFREER